MNAGDMGLTTPEAIELFDIMGDFDRFDFPGHIYRVTGGHGGEALLIIGSLRTALIDCGMAFCGRVTVGNIRKALAAFNRESLDAVLLSHSHYDHIGALPYIRKAFPKVKVYCSRRCAEILERPGARSLMKELGEAARDLYMPESREEIPVEGLEADVILEDGETVSLGRETVTAIETKGHTDCSMSFFLDPPGLLFASESTGVLEAADYVHTPVLKSFEDALRSADRCEACNAAYICLPHFGLLPGSMNGDYWELFRSAVRDKLEFVRTMKEAGLSEEKMMERYADRYWTPAKEKEQPKEAYIINSKNIVKAALRYLRSE